MTVQEKSTQDFIAGLKTIIRNSWPTQEEFAKGVTSKVNMSNILRGNSGVSFKMKKALADKAGMSINDIVDFGKITAQKENNMNYSFMSENSNLIGNIINPVHSINFTGGSMNELINITSELTLELQNSIARYARVLIGMVQNVANERDKLLKLLSQEQNITNTLSDGIALINKDKKILYANRVMMEKFQTTPGDNCISNSTYANWDKMTSTINEVFNSGKIIRKVITVNTVENEILFITAYPIIDSDRQITQVLIVISFGSVWGKLLVEQGWNVPTLTKKSNRRTKPIFNEVTTTI